VPKKCITIIDRSPPGGLRFLKEHSRAGVGCVFTHFPRAKKKAQDSILSKNVAAKWAPGNPRGGLGGPLGHPWGALGGPRGAVGDPKGSLGDPLLQTGALTKSLVLPHEWVHFGCQRGLGGIILEEVVDQSWPAKTSRRQRGHQGRWKKAEGSPKAPKGHPEGTQGGHATF
jgi:hypothetical protein